MSDSQSKSAPSEPLLIADHLALDLLNTEAGVGEQHLEFWRDGDDVVRWLVRCGIEVETMGAADKKALLTAAHELRSAARELVEARKRGQKANPERLNRFLAMMQSVPVLEWDDAGARLLQRALARSPLQPLGQVAQAVASLLAEGQFALVPQCEHPDCVMWFYDRTKSHRRRWCSMALCGNRAKAAGFRQRHGAGAGVTPA